MASQHQRLDYGLFVTATLERGLGDDFLDRLFEMYFKKLNLPLNLMRKANYHVLAQFVSKEMVDDEIKEKLDAIVEVAESAQPLQTKK